MGVALILAPWVWFLVRGLGANMDAVAVLLPVIGALAFLGLAILAAVRRRLLPLLVGVSSLMMVAVAVWSPRTPQLDALPRVPIRLAMANVYDGNPTPAAAASALERRGADLVAAVEMRPAFWRELTTDASLPYRVAVGQLGVESRWPLRLLAPNGPTRSRLLRVDVDVPRAPFVLYVVHALNPLHDFSTFADQRAFTRQVLAAAATERRPVVIVGDLNTSDRVQSYRMFTATMRDAMRADASPGSTYDDGWWSTLLLRIDHAFISTSWCADGGTTFTVPGSDHSGLQVTVGPCG